MGVDKIFYINPDPERPSRLDYRCCFLLSEPFPIYPSPQKAIKHQNKKMDLIIVDQTSVGPNYNHYIITCAQ